MNKKYMYLMAACLVACTGLAIAQLQVRYANLTKQDLEPFVFNKVLLIEAAEGNLDAVRDLVENKNASINAKTSDTHNTALHAAAFNGHLGVVRYLVNQQDIIINMRNKKRKTAMKLAEEQKHANVVQLLRERGGFTRQPRR